MPAPRKSVDYVSVVDLLPFWRFAVGPISGSSPAIPFYRYADAKAFFDKAVKDLPWSGCYLYQRFLLQPHKPLLVIEEYHPAASYPDGFYGSS